MNGDGPEAIPDRGELRRAYGERRPDYERILGAMEERIRSALEAASLRPTIKGRVKSFDSWYSKRIRLLRQARTEGIEPPPIADVVALRAVCPFLGDLDKAESAICAAFEVLEIERKGSNRSFREFGYESIHLMVGLPEDLRSPDLGFDLPAIELQLRTILQEAWAEVEHEIVYKAEFNPFDEPMKRKLAALSANLSLSDIIFQEILDYQRRLTAELERRRSAFYGKVEEVMDLPLAASEPAVASAAPVIPGRNVRPAEDGAGTGAERRALDSARGRTASMDDLLLAALTAHNREDYEGASRIYSEILGQEPAREIAVVVYKHRGMAFFSQSKYAEAIADFDRSLDLDPADYKAAYYRGVVRSVLQDYAGAIADFDLALGLHPYHFYSRYRRAMAYWHVGDYAQALSDAEAALKLEPENELASRLRDLAMRKMKM
jgi:putative GTP pyrophosphokinase